MKKFLKPKVILFYFVILVLVGLTVYSFPNISLVKDYQKLEITALAQKNDEALGHEVWIDSISIGDAVYNLENIDFDDNWIISGGKLVFVGTDKNTISISYPSFSDVKINFSKHSYSGKVLVETKIEEKEFDLYKAEYDVATFLQKSNENLSFINISLSIIAYYLIVVGLIFLGNKFERLKVFLPLLLYFGLSYLLGNTAINTLVMFSFMFLSYFLVCKNYKKNIYLVLIPLLIYFLVYNFIVPLNFRVVEGSSSVLYALVNLSFITVLLYGTNFIYNFWQNLKNKNTMYKRWLLFSLIYVVINLVFLVLIWPGNWIWDEKGMFLYAQQYMYNGWQSYLMVLFYSWSLMLCPFMVGIVLFQILVISFVVGYVLSRIYELDNSKKKIVILFVLLSLPPLILNILYPLRAALYSTLEILFLFQLYYWWRTKKEIQLSDLMFLGFGIVFLAFWRSEGIYYLLLGPLVIWFIFRKQFNSWKKLLKLVLMIVLFLLVYSPLKMLEGDNPNIYGLTIFPNPLTVMLQEDIDITEQEYEKIDKVFDVEILKEYPAYHEVPCFNYNLVREDYEEHMKDFILTYVKIILKNPWSYLKARTKTFLATTGMDKKYINNSPWGIYETKYEGEDREIINITTNDKLAKPINYEFRNKVVHILKGAYINNYDLTWYGQIIWNFLPMLLAFVIVVIYGFVKRKFAISFIGLLCLIKVPIIFITAPANYFFYYLSIYFGGLFIIGHFVNLFIDKIMSWRKSRKNILNF